MKKISWVTHPQYDIPLPKNHKFTSSKFSDLLSELEKRVHEQQLYDMMNHQKLNIKGVFLIFLNFLITYPVIAFFIVITILIYIDF